MNAPLKMMVLLATASTVWLASCLPAAAGSWVFRRSYYTHQPTTGVKLGRPLTGGPYYTRPQGAYVNSGWRNMRSTINVGGQSYDHVNIRESWIQYGEQF